MDLSDKWDYLKEFISEDTVGADGHDRLWRDQRTTLDGIFWIRARSALERFARAIRSTHDRADASNNGAKAP